MSMPSDFPIFVSALAKTTRNHDAARAIREHFETIRGDHGAQIGLLVAELAFTVLAEQGRVVVIRVPNRELAEAIQ